VGAISLLLFFVVTVICVMIIVTMTRTGIQVSHDGSSNQDGTPSTLQPVARVKQGSHVAIAAFLGETRLIDNGAL
jgi:hypothetical protein